MNHSLLGTLALVGTLAACSGSTAPTDNTPTSRVTLRFVNAEFGGTVNFYLNSVQKTQNQGGAVDSIYLKASSAPQAVTAKTAVSVMASASITFAVDTPYTVVLASDPAPDRRHSLLVFPDTVSAPPPGQALFRFVKVVNGVACPVDVYRTTGSADLTGLAPVASNVAQMESSPYVAFPTGPTHIIVTCAGAPDNVLLDSGTRTLSSGEAWTMLLKYNWSGGMESIGDLWIKDRS